MKNNNLDETINTRSVTPTETAYRDGYVRGQTQADYKQQQIDQIRVENERVRESNSEANGLLTGFIITALVGAGVAAYFVFTQGQKPAVKTATPQPPQETKVIEKTTNVIREIVPSIVPAPASAPAPASPSEVKVNISNPLQKSNDNPPAESKPQAPIVNNIQVPPAQAPAAQPSPAPAESKAEPTTSKP